MRGPGAPDDPPALVVITARRYRCVPCGAVIIVVPREVRGRRVYSASAIGFALALWGLVLATAAEVLRRSPKLTRLCSPEMVRSRISDRCIDREREQGGSPA